MGRVNGNSSVPQIVILARDVSTEIAEVTVGPERELSRLKGLDEIGNWIKAGAPLPPR